MNIGWPQGIVLALILYNLINHGFNHGEPRHEWYSHYNIGVQLVDDAVMLLILYWGGFFG